MARLTFKDGYGRWAFLLIGREITGNAANKLAQYENLGDPEDLAPVVLCKDCKYYKPYEVDGTDGECKRRAQKCLVCYDDFCSSAERTVVNDG